MRYILIVLHNDQLRWLGNVHEGSLRKQRALGRLG